MALKLRPCASNTWTSACRCSVRAAWRRSRWDFLRLQLRTQHGQRARREAFQCLRKIVREVPAISYLKGTGCATSCSVRIYTTTVAANDLHIGMLMIAEPIDQGVSRGILQQVDDAVSRCIHQNRAVAASAAKRKFVNPEYLWRLDGLLRERPHQRTSVVRLVGMARRLQSR